MQSFTCTNSCGMELARQIKLELIEANPKMDESYFTEGMLEEVIFRFVKIPLRT